MRPYWGSPNGLPTSSDPIPSARGNRLGSTVAAIAHRWGFAHLGRFAAAHKKMYGVTPLQTLRAAY